TGTGFNEKELARVMTRLKALETSVCPFAGKPKTNERPHWVRPELVAQIKFTEWTADGKLRHPVYLGLRDDKKPTDVRREEQLRVAGSGNPEPKEPKEPGTRNPVPGTQNPLPATLLDHLQTIESSRRDGILSLPDGTKLKVSNLHKVFWPKQ